MADSSVARSVVLPSAAELHVEATDPTRADYFATLLLISSGLSLASLQPRQASERRQQVCCEDV